MLFRKQDSISNKELKSERPLLLPASKGYIRPEEYGSVWWLTTTSIWNVDELILRRIRDWRRLTNETGHDGTRTKTMRSDHDSMYTGTHSVFPAPLAEWIILRYGGSEGGLILDAFSGGPPRGLVAGFMRYRYIGFDIRQEQIDENKTVLKDLGLNNNVEYICGDGTYLKGIEPESIDFGFTCPPYFKVEVYSALENDLSNLESYEEFNQAMYRCAVSYERCLKKGAFMCIIVNSFRTGYTHGEKGKVNELIDFPGHTISNFKDAGFAYWQSIILSRNFASAAGRSTTSWRGKKLIPRHEHLLVFRKKG